MNIVVLGVTSLAPLAVGAALLHTLYGWCRTKLYLRAQRSLSMKRGPYGEWGW